MYCRALSSLNLGSVEYDRDELISGISEMAGRFYPVGTTASFSCDVGYSLSSSSRRTCQTQEAGLDQIQHVQGVI